MEQGNPLKPRLRIQDQKSEAFYFANTKLREDAVAPAVLAVVVQMPRLQMKPICPRANCWTKFSIVFTTFAFATWLKTHQ